MLVKNIPATVKEAELRELFERHGSLERLLVSPFNTLAIVEYHNANQAELAMKNLAYHKINYIQPIYLEYAPMGIVSKQEKAESSDSDREEVQERQRR